MNIADRQKIAWIIERDRLASGTGIDPKVTLPRPGAQARRGRWDQTKRRVRRQTGSPNSSHQVSCRARIGLYDALTTTRTKRIEAPPRAVSRPWDHAGPKR